MLLLHGAIQQIPMWKGNHATFHGAQASSSTSYTFINFFLKGKGPVINYVKGGLYLRIFIIFCDNKNLIPPTSFLNS